MISLGKSTNQQQSKKDNQASTLVKSVVVEQKVEKANLKEEPQPSKKSKKQKKESKIRCHSSFLERIDSYSVNGRADSAVANAE